MGGVDLIEFDNIMSLIGGDMKDEEGWRLILPWIHSLTCRQIGQIGIYHSNEENKSYGTKTRAWQMDTTAKFEAVERFDTDVSFRLTFDKARERTPANRDEFEPINVALVADKWTYTTANRRAGNVSPVGQKYYEQLKVVLDGPTAVMRHGQKRAPLKDSLSGRLRLGSLMAGRKTTTGAPGSRITSWN